MQSSLTAPLARRWRPKDLCNNGEIGRPAAWLLAHPAWKSMTPGLASENRLVRVPYHNPCNEDGAESSRVVVGPPPPARRGGNKVINRTATSLDQGVTIPVGKPCAGGDRGPLPGFDTPKITLSLSLTLKCTCTLGTSLLRKRLQHQGHRDAMIVGAWGMPSKARHRLLVWSV